MTQIMNPLEEFTVKQRGDMLVYIQDEPPRGS